MATRTEESTRNRPSIYREQIDTVLRARGLRASIEPRYVEAWMRDQHPTFDGLTRAEFFAAVNEAIGCVISDTAGLSEQLAASHGL